MALTINVVGTTELDESSGLQRDDILLANVPTSIVDAFTAAGVDLTSAIQIAGDTTSNDLTLTGITGTVTSLNFLNSAGDAIDGDASGLYTLDGNQIFLYYGTGTDNVVVGREGSDATTADADGDIVFAIYLEQTGTPLDGGRFWSALYEPLQHLDDEDHDDFVDLGNFLKVGATAAEDFDFTGAPSGNSLFMMFGDASAAILVTGRSPDNPATARLNDGDTVNSSQGGGDTTLGTNGQQIKAGLGLYFTFVTGADPNYTVPNLSGPEARNESNIQFDDVLPVTEASFTVAQMTPTNSTVTIRITAYTTDAEPGTIYVEGLGDADDVPVTISEVYINGVATTFTLDGDTAVVSGVRDDDVITYVTEEGHSRVLIENGQPAGSNITFDIGGFAIERTDAAAVSVGAALPFYDDGPTVTADGTVPTLVTDDTDITDTDSASFAGLFSFDFGTDGPKDSDNDGAADADALTYTLGVSANGANSGLVDTLSGDAILLRLNGNVVEGYLQNATSTLAFTIEVDADGMVTQTQYRAVVHDDPTDPEETGSSAARLAAAGLVTLTATATDDDGDSDSDTLDIGDAFTFEDDGPSISVGNLVGAGNTNEAQLGFWQGLAGRDGLQSLGLTLDQYYIGNTLGDGTVLIGTPTVSNGDVSFNVQITDDFTGDGEDETLEYDLTFKDDGSYEFVLANTFGSEVTVSSANGQLDAGGPDPVRTLTIPTPSGSESIVFFGVRADTSTDDIDDAIGLTEAEIQNGDFDFLGTANMNVSTSGIGIGNNNFDGSTLGIAVPDESFVIDPESLVTKMKIYIDNSVGGYTLATEDLFYRYRDANGDWSDFVEVNDVTPEAGRQVSFEIDPPGSLEIDAVQLVMGRGTIKIPVIEFTISGEQIANPVYMDLTATLLDGDDDSASSSFSIDLETDPNPALEPDLTYQDHEFRLGDTDDQADAFNFDLTGSDDQWLVRGFDSGVDKLVLSGLNGPSDYSLVTSDTGNDVITATVLGIPRTITIDNGAAEITTADIFLA